MTRGGREGPGAKRRQGGSSCSADGMCAAALPGVAVPGRCLDMVPANTFHSPGTTPRFRPPPPDCVPATLQSMKRRISGELEVSTSVRYADVPTPAKKRGGGGGQVGGPT